MNEVDYRFFLDKKYEKETKAKCGCKYFSNVNLHVEVLENALILPGDNQGRGGILFQGEMLPQSSYRRGVARLYEFDENDVFNSDEEVVWIGMWPTVWGHCLTDNVKHLWFLFHPEYDYLKKYKMLYSTIWGTTFDEKHNFWQLLRIWGIDTGNICRLEKPTRFKRVFLPDESFIHTDEGKFYTKEFALLYDNTTIPTPKKRIPLYDKVYFTRTGWGGGKDFGEKRIETAFRKMGYHVLCPEILELDELICVLRNCKVLATTEGSISHNCLFLEKGTKVVIIRKAYYVNMYQLAINEIRELQVTIIDSHKSVGVSSVNPMLGPFFLYCGKNLQKFAPNIKLGKFPLIDFLIYLRKSKYIRKSIKRILTNMF